MQQQANQLGLLAQRVILNQAHYHTTTCIIINIVTQSDVKWWKAKEWYRKVDDDVDTNTLGAGASGPPPLSSDTDAAAAVIAMAIAIDDDDGDDDGSDDGDGTPVYLAGLMEASVAFSGAIWVPSTYNR